MIGAFALGLLVIAVESAAFGGWRCAGQGPDLLVVLLLLRSRGQRSPRAALIGATLGLARDLVATTRPGTFTLAYLVLGLLLAEVESATRWSGAGARAALAGLATALLGALGLLLGAALEPGNPFVGEVHAIGVCAGYTALVAVGAGEVASESER